MSRLIDNKELIELAYQLGIYTADEARQKLKEQRDFEKRISTLEGLEQELNKYGR